MISPKQQTSSSHLKLGIMCALLLMSACTNTRPMGETNSRSQENVEETITSESFPGWNNPMLIRTAQYAGQALINDLRLAQKALDINNIKQATSYLNAAHDLTDGIRTMMPFTVALDQIHDAKGDISDNADLFETDTLLPIYQSLEELDVYSPEVAQQSRAKVSQAEKLAKTGKNMQAIEILDQVETDLASTTVYLPVIVVSQHLDNALSALKDKSFNKANAQEEIDMALTSMINETRGVAVKKKVP